MVVDIKVSIDKNQQILFYPPHPQSFYIYFQLFHQYELNGIQQSPETNQDSNMQGYMYSHLEDQIPGKTGLNVRSNEMYMFSVTGTGKLRR